MNPRKEIETLIEAALAPLVADGTLATVVSVGGRSFEEVLRSVNAKSPFVLIKYTGKGGGLQDGGTSEFDLAISLMIGISTLKSSTARRLDSYDVLEAIEECVSGKQLSTVFYPMSLEDEAYTDLTANGMEVWSQVYATSYEVQH